ncbi:transcription initiation protein [Streptosporangiaceae bacterium NEAU-GS5]|nr:transcription initiation protein [Streptosporangiaceae bacterium NEAU-GS5]
MKYALMFIGCEDEWDALPADERDKFLAAWVDYTSYLAASHPPVDGARLARSSTATTLRPGGLVTDGPYAETAEQVAGFVVIEADDLDQAAAIAATAPAPIVQIRQVREM